MGKECGPCAIYKLLRWMVLSFSISIKNHSNTVHKQEHFNILILFSFHFFSTVIFAVFFWTPIIPNFSFLHVAVSVPKTAQIAGIFYYYLLSMKNVVLHPINSYTHMRCWPWFREFVKNVCDKLCCRPNDINTHNKYLNVQLQFPLDKYSFNSTVEMLNNKKQPLFKQLQ